jgi:hypothetical protein
MVVACDDDEEPTGPETITFTANLTGANERPNPVNTTATGNATVTLTETNLGYVVNITGLASDARLAHIHAGDANTAGPIVFDFYPGAQAPAIRSGAIVPQATTNLATATAPLLRITMDSLVKLLNTGNAYVNVHSVTSPGGEIRGQLVRQ